MHTPASDHPHVTEGICLCEPIYEEVVTGGLLFEPGIVRRYQTGLRYSPLCGLSAHRVKAVGYEDVDTISIKSDTCGRQ